MSNDPKIKEAIQDVLEELKAMTSEEFKALEDAIKQNQANFGLDGVFKDYEEGEDDGQSN